MLQKEHKKELEELEKTWKKKLKRQEEEFLEVTLEKIKNKLLHLAEL